MNRRRFLALLVLGGHLVVVPQAGFAQSVGDQIARQLRRRGYSDVTVSRTLLGRIRVVGTRGTKRREIVVNPSSGEILRDLVIDNRTGSAASTFDDGGGDDDDNGSEGSGGGGNGGNGGGDGGGGGDDGDDGDDDDDGDDGDD